MPSKLVVTSILLASFFLPISSPSFADTQNCFVDLNAGQAKSERIAALADILHRKFGADVPECPPRNVFVHSAGPFVSDGVICSPFPGFPWQTLELLSSDELHSDALMVIPGREEATLAWRPLERSMEQNFGRSLTFFTLQRCGALYALADISAALDLARQNLNYNP